MEIRANTILDTKYNKYKQPIILDNRGSDVCSVKTGVLSKQVSMWNSKAESTLKTGYAPVAVLN